jgi:phosphate transport system substrate-binding protein
MVMTADSWSDVNPSWPNEPVLKFIPGTDSGTFDYFVEEVCLMRTRSRFSPPPTYSSPRMTTSSSRVSKAAPTRSVFFGYAYYEGEGDALKILSIDGVEANTAKR